MTRMDFHIHSDYSDGSASLEDIVTEALRWRLEAIGIVDHVRGDADWLVDRQRRIDGLRDEYGDDIEIFSGIEVKVKDEAGALNVLPEAVQKADFVVGSFHGVPADVEERAKVGGGKALVDWWHDCMCRLIDGDHEAQVVGHPDRVLVNRGLSIDRTRLDVLSERAASSRIFLEWNPASVYPTQPFSAALADRDAGNVTYGSDAHSIPELADAMRTRTQYESGIVERGNEEFLSTLRGRRSKRS